MTQLNRQSEPSYTEITHIPIIEPQKSKLDNGIEIFSISAGDQELMKIDFVFDAGEWKQQNRLVAGTTNLMLSEGTKSFTSEQLAEGFDFLGTYAYYQTGKHHNIVTIYTLNKYLEDTLKYVEELIKHPIFPERELQVYTTKKKQQYLIENEKVEVLAQKEFAKTLFGTQHPYGNIAEANDFDLLDKNNLIEFHKTQYHAENCYIVVAGKVEDKHIKLINKYFGSNDWSNNTQNNNQKNVILKPSDLFKVIVPKKDAVQSAIRIGKLLVNKPHPDYTKLQILNTVLGGYFGSRLMTNIREDKGYTYGIGSGIVSQREAGYFVIVSQVGKDVCSAAIEEVYKELEKLRNELIPEQELQLVKNYMLGTMLRNFDGPFAQSDSFKTIKEYNLSYDYYKNFIKTIQSITPKELRELANTYFQQDSMYEITAG